MKFAKKKLALAILFFSVSAFCLSGCVSNINDSLPKHQMKDEEETQLPQESTSLSNTKADELSSTPATVSEEPSEKPKSDEWKAAYKQYLLNFASFPENSEHRFKLEYIDGDDVPELLICEGTANGKGFFVYQYCQNEVKKVNEYCYGMMGTFDFIEKENFIKSDHSNKGYIHYDFYSIEGGQEKKLQSFFNDAAVKPEGECVYKINDEEVSEDVYYDEYNKLNDAKNYKTLGYDDCLSITESNINNQMENSSI